MLLCCRKTSLCGLPLTTPLSFPSGSLHYTSPQLDQEFGENLTTKQLLKRLHLTRKLLALKKLALKNRTMAVNLENLLPQAPESSLFSVPSNGSEQVSDLGDLFSPSMYGNGELSSLLGDAILDPSLSLKCDFPSPIGVQYVDSRETLYQTNSAGK